MKKLHNKKTGKIKDFEFVVITKDMDAEFAKYAHHAPVLICRSIDQLNEEWEDYKPAEPLIKDEKIRKAVRAFAEANGLDKVYYSADFVRFSDDPDFSISIDFYKYLPNIASERTYTIAELCGEEEK